MVNLTEANLLADRIVARDNSPFPRFATDSVLFIPHMFEEGSLGRYEDARTGGEGIASKEEFGRVFYKMPDSYLESMLRDDYDVGLPVTGFSTNNRIHQRGVVAQRPFLTIKRTPDMYDSERMIHKPSEPRRYNIGVQKFNTYIGNLWLAIDYPGVVDGVRTYVSLEGVARDSGQEDIVMSGARSNLIFGEEHVAMALQAYLTRFQK